MARVSLPVGWWQNFSRDITDGRCWNQCHSSDAPTSSPVSFPRCPRSPAAGCQELAALPRALASPSAGCHRSWPDCKTPVALLPKGQGAGRSVCSRYGGRRVLGSGVPWLGVLLLVSGPSASSAWCRRVSPGLSSSPFCALGSPMRAATVVAWGHGGCLGQAVLS